MTLLVVRCLYFDEPLERVKSTAQLVKIQRLQRQYTPKRLIRYIYPKMTQEIMKQLPKT